MYFRESINTFLFQSFLVGDHRYRVVETCGLDSFCQIIFVGVFESIVPREAIQNALSDDLRELIFLACENLSFTANFYELRLNILLRYSQEFNAAAVSFVPSAGHFYVSCYTNINFVIACYCKEFQCFKNAMKPARLDINLSQKLVPTCKSFLQIFETSNALEWL